MSLETMNEEIGNGVRLINAFETNEICQKGKKYLFSVKCMLILFIRKFYSTNDNNIQKTDYLHRNT